MQYNCSFTTYRRASATVGRDYSGSATITNGSGFYEPAGGDLKGVLGIDLAVKAYLLLTEETDLQIGDKIVIAGVTYYIHDLESLPQTNAINLSRAIIVTKEEA